MRARYFPFAGAALLALSACVPAADYTESEWPKAPRLDAAPAHLAVRFAPGSSRLSPDEAARLRAIAEGGGLVPSDRVVVAVAGPPALASARFDAIAAALLPYRVRATPAPHAAPPPDYAVIRLERYLVTLPACPNWSKAAAGAGDFSNTFPSNFGCAASVNLGLTVATPADLLGGRNVGWTEAQPAAAAVSRYLNDQVVLPAAARVGPIAASASAAPGTPGAGTGGSGGQP
jgi:type IV pilus biogenesis protein CpaD/CtpE